jgi:hypothetical protein
MIRALKPGGWLIDEEYDSVSLLPDPAINPGEVLLQTQVAVNRLLDDGGVDRLFGRRLIGRLRAHGLINVSGEARSFMWQRGCPGARLARATYEFAPARLDRWQLHHLAAVRGGPPAPGRSRVSGTIGDTLVGVGASSMRGHLAARSMGAVR